MSNRIGKKIRDLRNSFNETQNAFAFRFGVEQATISRWEDGRRVKEKYRRAIADLAETTIVDFFYLDEENIGKRYNVDKVAVVGILARGIWREKDALITPPHAEVSPVPESDYVEFEQFSMYCQHDFGTWIRRGEYAICVPYQEIRDIPQHNDVVVVEHRQRELSETTVMRLIQSGRPGQKEGNLQTLKIDAALTEEYAITGLIIGVYRPTIFD